MGRDPLEGSPWGVHGRDLGDVDGAFAELGRPHVQEHGHADLSGREDGGDAATLDLVRYEGVLGPLLAVTVDEVDHFQRHVEVLGHVLAQLAERVAVRDVEGPLVPYRFRRGWLIIDDVD